MTRGNWVIIKWNDMKYTIQFNWDMYPTYKRDYGYDFISNWDTMIQYLIHSNYENFSKNMLEFNQDTFQYDDEIVYEEKDFDPNLINFNYLFNNYTDYWSEMYYDQWHSDYLYIKNDNDYEIKINLKSDYGNKYWWYEAPDNEAMRFENVHAEQNETQIFLYLQPWEIAVFHFWDLKYIIWNDTTKPYADQIQE